jgi:hypothetical protein
LTLTPTTMLTYKGSRFCIWSFIDVQDVFGFFKDIHKCSPFLQSQDSLVAASICMFFVIRFYSIHVKEAIVALCARSIGRPIVTSLQFLLGDWFIVVFFAICKSLRSKNSGCQQRCFGPSCLHYICLLFLIKFHSIQLKEAIRALCSRSTGQPMATSLWLLLGY